MPGTEKKVKSRERGIVVNLQGSHEDTQKNRKEEYQTRCTTEDSVFTLKLCAVPHFLNVMLKTHTHTNGKVQKQMPYYTSGYISCITPLKPCVTAISGQLVLQKVHC